MADRVIVSRITILIVSWNWDSTKYFRVQAKSHTIERKLLGGSIRLILFNQTASFKLACALKISDI